MIRETSLEIFLQIKRENMLSPIRQLIYENIYNFGPKTAREVVRDLNLETNMSGRFTEMRVMGVLKESGKRECNVTGRTAILWQTTNGMPNNHKKPTKDLLRTEAMELCKSIAMVEMSTEHKEQLRNLYKLILKL